MNIYSSGSTTGTSVTVTGLPTNGVTLYATLYSEISGSWVAANYTYTEAGSPVLAAITSPAPGSTLSGAAVTFSWSAGAGPTGYWLYLGTTGANSSNVYNSGGISGTSVTVGGLPTGGVTLYATLFSKISGVWQPVNYTFTEAGTTVLAAMTSPSPGSTLFNASPTFSWSAGSGPTAYWLYVGTTGAGSANLYSSGSMTATSVAVSGLPTTGATVYVTLFSQINGAWQPVHYTYTEASPPASSTMISPIAGSTLAGSSVTFSWTAGSQVSAYWLYLGNTGAGSMNLYSSGSITTTSVTVSGLPTNGVNLYASLYSEINGTWQPVKYTYTEAGTLTMASITSPGSGTILPGSTVTFNWSPGSGPTGYWLYLGSTGAGSANLFNSGALQGTSATVSGLPTGGATIYATLYSQVNGAWKPASYTYTESGSSAEATLGSLSCTTSSMTGAGTDACTVTLAKAANTGGVDVSLSSSAAAITVPALVTVPAGATSVGFTANIAAVSSPLGVTLSAGSDSVSKTFLVALDGATPMLTVGSSTVAFGDVVLSSPATESLTLTSTGTLPLVIASASTSGSGFSWSGVTFPITLNPNQSATVELEFNPTATGISNGTLTVASNSSTGSSAIVNLSGTGQLSPYQVDLSWQPVTDGSLTISGYYVFRATSGSTNYEQITPSLDTQTSFSDLNVLTGVTYDYYIESVDSVGVASSPSTVFSISVP